MSTTTRLLITLVLACGLLAGCVWVSPAERKQMRTVRKDAERDALQEEETLAATARADALLMVARFQDARRGHEDLVALSRHVDPVVRAAAARAIGLVAESGAEGVLVHLLEDPDVRVVRQAAFALSQVPHFRATDGERAGMTARIEEALVTELDDCRRDVRWGDGGRPEVCRIVIRSLGAIGGEAANGVLWDALSKGITPPALQRAVAVALAVQGKAGRGKPITAEQVSYLAPLLIQTDNPAQWAGAYLLARGEVAEDGVAAARELLALAWSRAGSATARVWTLRALGELGGDAAHAIVGGVLADADATIRDQVAALRASEALDLTSLVVQRLSATSDDTVRAEALGAVAESGAPEAFAWLDAYLATDAPAPPVVVAAAGLASNEAAPKSTHDGLAALLGHRQPDVRRAAAGALAGVSTDDVEAALLATLAVETERAVRIDLAVALAERPSPAVEGRLLELVRGEDPILGAIAAEGLGPRAGGHIMTRLMEAFESANAPGDEERRLAIVQALLSREDAPVELARAALNDAEPLVREAAWGLVVERFDRATLDEERAPPRPLPELSDPLWGVGNVLGATIRTARGPIELSLHALLAPAAVANWVGLAESGFYDGVVFHRVVPDFVVQAGDPIGSGWGGPGHTIRCEYSAEPYRRGTLGMALSGKDTGGSQWFFTLAPAPHLDGRYTVFGQMTAGDAVLDAIVVGDRIEGIDVHRRAVAPGQEKAPAN